SRVDVPLKEVQRIIDAHWDPTNQLVFKGLQEALHYSRLSPAALQQLQETTGCPAEEIEPVLRLKVLEFMILINQAGLSFPSGKTFLPIASYQNPVDIAAG